MSEDKSLAPLHETEQQEENVAEYKVTQTIDVEESPPVKVETEEKHEVMTGIGVVMLCLLLLGTLWFFFNGNSITGKHETVDAQTLIKEHESPPLKADKLDPKKAYKLVDASDTLNKATVTLKHIQFRKDGTRLWIHFENNGATKINMMPNVNATLIDNNGHTYKVDPFAGNQVTGLAPGTNEDIMLVFEPVREDAKQITFHLDMIFDMKNAPWQVAIPVEIP